MLTARDTLEDKLRVSGMVPMINHQQALPWDLVEFGAFLPYSRLLEATPPGIRPGNCFPAGHASTGFVLMAFYFAGRARRRLRLARAGLAVGLVAGLVLDLGRMLQGAHFLSHTLWSAVVCWIVITLFHAAILRPRKTPSA